jgi:hypothetical protein
MTTNLHEMFGLPDKKVDYKARLIAATEHMRSEVKDVFRELGLQEDDPRQRRLMDACNALVQAATEMADAHTDHVEQRVAQPSHRAIIKMRREVAMTETDINRALLPQRVSLMLAVALIAGMAGFVAGLYYSAYTETSVVRFSWTAPPSHKDRIAISPVPI